MIRYAKTMTLKINLDTVHEEMINVPYLFIEYRERARRYVEDDSLTELSFNSEYIMSTKGFWEGASAAFYVFMAIFVIIWFVVMVVAYKKPQLEVETNARCIFLTVKGVYFALDIFSQLMFWYLFLMTGYWFIFFKL